MIGLYTLTIFLSAALLFLVQPMFARLVLPLLGGSPAVWNTAMVFYQTALLAGYAYAHASAAWLGARRSAALHLVVLLLPLAVLPLAIPAGWTPPADRNPALWLLALMSVAVGLPFFAAAATSPLLQTWLAATRDRRASDPYFLYAASNAGSLLALVSYPVLVEPSLRLGTQSRAWSWGYGALVLAIASCALVLWKNFSMPDPSATIGSKENSPPLTAVRRARWVLLAFAPSSLLLGVTTFLSSEIAAVPLLWVVPLALYLLTFVFAFARRQVFSRALLGRALPLVLVPLVLTLNLQATQPIGALLGLHLVVLFLGALLCHTRLAADRPDAAHLTEFYLWLSVGGVLGGAFNALLAPLVFHSVAEYPLTLVLVAWLALDASAPRSLGDWLWPLALGALVTGAALALDASRWRTEPAVAGVVFGAAALGCFFFSRRPLRFALGVAALLVAGNFYHGEKGRVLHAERSFFGVHRVTLDPTEKFHLLVHGMTLHGTQSLDPARRHESLTYYHRTGPIGDVLARYARDPAKKIGAVGLGAGSLAALAQPKQAWTYFEIDPVVEKLARDARYFTFLHDAATDVRVVLGDARLSLAREADASFDLLILDAYSSDAIPVHLVTREALALYLRKLAPGGLLAFHISNLHLDLEPVFANLARDAHLLALTRDDTVISAAERALGKAPSVWLVMARSAGDLAPLARDSRWQPSRVDPANAVWSDDFSSLLSVFRWR